MTDPSPKSPPTAPVWAPRAAAAEAAVRGRHLRRVWALPMTRLGVVGWPAVLRDVLHVGWNYWWQAHLVDCLIDAELRDPRADRRAATRGLLRGIRLRNQGRWLNIYYDDIAWLGLALHRARDIGVNRPGALRDILTRLRSGWSPDAGGGLWWRVGDNFKNTPATGPAAILFARLGTEADTGFAAGLTDWLDKYLVDPATGLVGDGLRVAPDGSISGYERNVYTYCQGVFLGACVELARATGEPGWSERAGRTVAAVAANLCDDHGVLRGHGGGDGGLFTGILTRYLALAAVRLPAHGGAEAARMVFASARAAWDGRLATVGGPVFAPAWGTPAVAPSGTRFLARHEEWSRRVPEYDLSVQLSAWMALEAAALLERGDSA